MKILFIISFLFSSVIHANNLATVQKTLIEMKYFTAAGYLKSMLKSGKSSKKLAFLMNKTLPYSGIYPFLDIPLKRLVKLKSYSNINYLIGKKYFFLKKDKQAMTYFNKVRENTPFYPATLLHLSSLYEIVGNKGKALMFSKKCRYFSKKNKFVTPIFNKEVADINREYIYDLCEILPARLSYKDNKVKESKKRFEKINHASYQFPAILFNSSWVHFRLKDYPRAVGQNLTFQAPLLEDYLYPETELVKTLSYVRLCQYDEAVNIIKNYQGRIKGEVEKFIKRFGLKNAKAEHAFMKLFFDKKLKKKIGNNFIYKMFRVLKRNPAILTLNAYQKRLKVERKKIKNKAEFRAYKKSLESFVKFYNTYVKVKFVKYSDEVIRVSNILTEVEVDIYTFLKEKYYEQKKNNEKDKEAQKFYIAGVSRKSNQHLWNFHGEFWADELGYYVPKLENRCGRKKK